MDVSRRLLWLLIATALLTAAIIAVAALFSSPPVPPAAPSAVAIQPSPYSPAAFDGSAAYQQALDRALSDPQAARALADQAATDPEYAERANTLQNGLLNAARSDDPAHQAALIGQTLAAVGAWPQAHAAFQAAVAAQPDYVEAWAYLGETSQQVGEDPLPALEHALALDPDSIAANTILATFLRRQGQPEQALVYLQHAASLVPESTALQADIGATLVALGNVQDARTHYERIVELTPDDPYAWQLLSGYAINNEVFVDEVGIPAAREALLLAPEDPIALTLLGRGYALLEQPLLAARFYQQATTAAPDYGPAYYYFGLLRLAQGQPDDAHALLQRAVDLLGNEGVGARAAEVLARYFP